MENNKKKESYLAKLKNLVVKHFTNIIEAEVQEYKDNIEIKYDMEVKVKKSLADYITDMVKFNNSSKVSDKIKATKDELTALLKDCKEQVKVALKGDKYKFDDDAMDEFIDNELDFDLEDNKIGTESDSVDSRDAFEYTLSSVDDAPLPKKYAAIFLNMVISADLIPGVKDFLATKSDIYLLELFEAACTLVLCNNKNESGSKYDKDLQLLLKQNVPSSIATEDSSKDSAQYIADNVTPEVTEVNVSNLKPTTYSEDILNKYEDLKTRMQGLNTRVLEYIVDNTNDQVNEFCSIVNNVLHSLCKSMNSPIYTVISLVNILLTEKEDDDSLSLFESMFILSFLNLIPEEINQEIKNLVDESNKLINE